MHPVKKGEITLFSQDSCVYLRDTEVREIIEHLKIGGAEDAPKMGKPVAARVNLSSFPSLIYGHASPTNRSKLIYNHDDLAETFKTSFDFSTAFPALSYKRLADLMGKRCEIFVLAAHIEEDGTLVLVEEADEGMATRIPFNQFVDLTASTRFSPTLSIMLCCNSKRYAETLSGTGGFAVGVVDDLPELIAPSLLKRLLKHIQGRTEIFEIDLKTSLQGFRYEHSESFEFELYFKGQKIC
ncbi:MULTISPECIES: hypothetical protein [unclassified Yoonia]|uniref:hypothetical protein n=1 Tax=unclassified Yoonia TaxID=2629118 RepID=UPI002B003BA5|nr:MULTISPECIES: hypothetical protein [unclassified Yoonia]